MSSRWVVFCTNTSQVGAIFVYCKTGAGGKLVNEEDGVGCIIGFYSWQLLMFDWKSQKRKLFAHCLHKIVLHNERIDDFVCLQKLISSFLTSDNTQLSWILTKLLKFEFIFWVLRIGILLLQNLNMLTE